MVGLSPFVVPVTRRSLQVMIRLLLILSVLRRVLSRALLM